MKAIVGTICLLVLATVLGGCWPTTRQVRQHTYPPEVMYIADSQIREAMVSMANGIIIIDSAQLDPYPTIMIVDALGDMRRASISMAVPATRLVVPPIDVKMGRLLRDIDDALLDSAQNPPSHARAQALHGSCMYCHHQRVALMN